MEPADAGGTLLPVLEIRAEIPGTVSTVDVAVGAQVGCGASILSIESMKMEYPVLSPADGAVAQICVAVGDVVEENQVLARLQP
jgi:biotin carboxyl carrier protein